MHTYRQLQLAHLSRKHAECLAQEGAVQLLIELIRSGGMRQKEMAANAFTSLLSASLLIAHTKPERRVKTRFISTLQQSSRRGCQTEQLQWRRELPSFTASCSGRKRQHLCSLLEHSFCYAALISASP
jgi:hypothetical protein